MKNIVAMAAGIIFSLGLGIAGMTQTHVVRGFLDVTGDWNAALLGVMVGAIAVHAIVYLMIKNKPSPLLDTKFHLPTRKDIDWKLISGAALFGLGWGWAGICPGPGIAALASGNQNIILFVVSMLGAMLIFRYVVEERI